MPPKNQNSKSIRTSTTNQKSIRQNKRVIESDEENDQLFTPKQSTPKQQKSLKTKRKNFENDELYGFDQSEESSENDIKKKKTKQQKNQRIKTNEKNIVKNTKQQSVNKNKKTSKQSSGGKVVQNQNSQQLEFDFTGEYDQESNKVDLDNVELPKFLQKNYIRDKNQHRPDHPQFDPTTLYIPPDDEKKFSPVFRQYWNVKQINMDKVVVIKIWKFYHAFYEDAIIIHRHLDLRLSLWGKKLSCFFHESLLHKTVSKILDYGYQIMVVEQMENSAGGESELIKREICQILTRGTYTEYVQQEYESKYLLSIVQYKNKFGVVYLDSTTHEFFLGDFEDDESLTNLRTLVYRIKPVEIIYYKAYMQEKSLNVLKYTVGNNPTMNPQGIQILSKPQEILEKVDQYFYNEETKEQNLPQIFQDIVQQVKQWQSNKADQELEASLARRIVEEDCPFYFTLQALYLSLSYLEQVMLAETVFSMGNFYFLDIYTMRNTYLHLDAQSLINLEILDLNFQTKVFEQYSLLQFMDYTKTPYGKRLFRKWLQYPLVNPQQINERLDAVEDLMKFSDAATYFQDTLSGLPDIERQINKIYNNANKQKLSGCYIENYTFNRLNEFIDFLQKLKKIESIMDVFADYQKYFKSKRLLRLTTFREINQQDLSGQKGKKRSKSKLIQPEEALFPRINNLIQDIENMVVNYNGVPTPAPGIDSRHDMILDKINKTKDKLNEYLLKQRQKFINQNINYVHVKHRYELEIPEQLVEGNKKPSDFYLTSKRQGFVRFQDQYIHEQCDELNRLDEAYKECLIPFIIEYFKKFYERNTYWLQVISCLAELDCLCSLAKLSSKLQVRCRPILIDTNNNNQPIFELIQMCHPTLLKLKKDFIANDTIFNNNINVMLVTGPNMGGKSTILRQNCLAIIMAQVGSYVPAESFTLTPKDRIFTRIGATDRIIEGKSTFFIEMEETLTIVKEGTKHSFAIIDELGRGTSTFDGYAIAYSVLKYISDHVQCQTLFSTHYHLLLEEFILYPNIENYFMKCELDTDSDTLKFHYLFTKGETPSSFGILVAKSAGLPDHVITVAKNKSQFMLKESHALNNYKMIQEKFNKLIAELEPIEQGEEENQSKFEENEADENESYEDNQPNYYDYTEELEDN